jgi:ferredoxin
MSRLKIVVDWELCESNAVCVQAAPELFRLDDDDQLHPAEYAPEAQLEKARAAVQRCPRAAISLVEDE